MKKKQSHKLSPKKHFAGQKPGLALVKWLNNPKTSLKFIDSKSSLKSVEDLLRDAQVVFRWLTEYPSVQKLNVAQKKKKLPSEFRTCHQRLNETLATFVYAPQVDLQEFTKGEPISWYLLAEEPPIALVNNQVRCVLQLIEQGAILKIRRCKECQSWFFAQFAHRVFCNTSCQIKHFAGSEKFKKQRRKYMRQYYWLTKSKNIK